MARGWGGPAGRFGVVLWNCESGSGASLGAPFGGRSTFGRHPPIMLPCGGKMGIAQSDRQGPLSRGTAKRSMAATFRGVAVTCWS